MPHADLDRLPKLYRSATVRVAERVAMERYGLDEDDLMARAGLAAWRMLLDRWPQALRIGIACGPGNNGGDGYVLAELARASGRHVQVLRLHETVKAGAARRATEVYLQAGGSVANFRADASLPDVDLWVDALFGIGLRRALEGQAAALVDALNRHDRTPIFSLDVPSGVDADTGHHDGVAVRADATLSFICGKPGLYTGRGRALAGDVRIDRLGLDDGVFDDLEPSARLASAEMLAHWLPPRVRDAHKGDFGRVLCVGGDAGYGGAIALCAEAAHRTGAGLVSVATRAEHVAVVLARRPECMTRAVERSDELRPLLDNANIIAIGPGLGQGEWGATMLEVALETTLAQRLPIVIDADALNMLARFDPRPLGDAVLTPHPGEAARLLGMTVEEVECDRVQSARHLAARYDCVVLLKGAGTVVMAPGEIPVIVDAGNPGMASGGMGDALTGTIAAMLAQFSRKGGVSPFAATVYGALLHSCAADAAARDGGERGLLASDLFPHLRRLANPAAQV
jgi:ADP-dependent NAD(P)H-hydrate dehydratase / NAD(P)H-hydrate epimerase